MLKIKSENSDDLTIHYNNDDEDIEYQIYFDEEIEKGDENNE